MRFLVILRLQPGLKESIEFGKRVNTSIVCLIEEVILYGLEKPFDFSFPLWRSGATEEALDSQLGTHGRQPSRAIDTAIVQKKLYRSSSAKKSFGKTIEQARQLLIPVELRMSDQSTGIIEKSYQLGL